MKTSEIFKESARSALIGGISFVLGIITVLTVITLSVVLGLVELDTKTFLLIVGLFLLLCLSSWFFIDYFNEKKIQRELEKEEAEREKQQLAAREKSS